MPIANFFDRLTGIQAFKLFTKSGRQEVDSYVSNGVPAGFDKITSNTLRRVISKGNLNKIGMVSRILNEHVESSREIQSTITPTNIVSQIFLNSKDNISALMLTLGSAEAFVIDDFEDYVDNADLQGDWIASGALATLEQTIVHDGTQAMSLPTTNNGDMWTTASLPQDFTGYTGTFNAYFSHSVSQQQISVFIADSVGNSKFSLLTQDGPGIWCDCEVDETGMTEDPGNTLPTDVTDIVIIGYEVTTKRVGGTVIIDNLASIPPPGSIRIKLRDMGTELPEAGVTALDDGTPYDQIGVSQTDNYILSLDGGVQLYHIEEFFCGIDKAVPDNKLLNDDDHYYALQLEYVDTEVNVFGPDTSFEIQYYDNGFAFTAPDEATPITAIGEFSDLMFGILSMQDVYITRSAWRFDNEPNGNSKMSVFIESPEKMKITDMIVDHEHSPEKNFAADLSARPMLLKDGGKHEDYYNDDPTDSVTSIVTEMTFWYKPPIVNG